MVALCTLLPDRAIVFLIASAFLISVFPPFFLPANFPPSFGTFLIVIIISANVVIEFLVLTLPLDCILYSNRARLSLDVRATRRQHGQWMDDSDGPSSPGRFDRLEYENRIGVGTRADLPFSMSLKDYPKRLQREGKCS